MLYTSQSLLNANAQHRKSALAINPSEDPDLSTLTLHISFSRGCLTCRNDHSNAVIEV